MPSAHHVLLLCRLLQRPQVWQGLWIGLLVALGERHGAEVRVLRCGGRGAWGAWCQWPRGAWIFVPSPHHVLLLCRLLQGPQVGQELRIELPVALGERHGAEVRVLRCGGRGAWGAWCQWPRGAWVFVPSAHHVLLLCCLLQGPQAGKELQIGLLVAPGECHGAEMRVLR